MAPKNIFLNSDDLLLLFASNLKYEHRFLTNLSVVIGYEKALLMKIART